MITERPKITLPVTAYDLVLEAIAVVLLAFNIITVLLNFSALPAEVPRHFNAAGNVDGVGAKSMMLILPFINIFTFVLVVWAQRVPHLHNFPVKLSEKNIAAQYQNSVRMLRTTKVILTSIFAFISYVTIETAFARMNGLTVWFIPISMAALSGTMIYYVTRSYRLQ